MGDWEEEGENRVLLGTKGETSLKPLNALVSFLLYYNEFDDCWFMIRFLIFYSTAWILFIKLLTYQEIYFKMKICE